MSSVIRESSEFSINKNREQPLIDTSDIDVLLHVHMEGSHDTAPQSWEFQVQVHRSSSSHRANRYTAR
jgi:hypothetical protein